MILKIRVAFSSVHAFFTFLLFTFFVISRYHAYPYGIFNCQNTIKPIRAGQFHEGILNDLPGRGGWN